jgi:hypothetical protein
MSTPPGAPIDELWQHDGYTLETRLAQNEASFLSITLGTIRVGGIKFERAAVEALSSASDDVAVVLPVDNVKPPAAPERLLEPKELFNQLREANPRKRRERPSDYAIRLHGLMEAQRSRLRKRWDLETVGRELRGRK